MSNAISEMYDLPDSLPKADFQNRRTSLSPEGYTPEWFMKAVWKVIGYPDLDPASCEKANQQVKADHFFTKEDNGLDQLWHVPSADGDRFEPATVFLNPPGGLVKKDDQGIYQPVKAGGESLTKLFWKKWVEERRLGRVKHGIFLAFSTDALATTQTGCGLSLADFPHVILRQRIAYLQEQEDGSLKKKSGTANYSAAIYVPGDPAFPSSLDRSETFYEVFSQFGRVSVPYWYAYPRV